MDISPPEETFYQRCDPDREEIIKFLKNFVIDKKLVTDEVIYQLEEGKFEGVYSDEMFFSNLTLSDQGFQFDMTTVTCEKSTFWARTKSEELLKKILTA